MTSPISTLAGLVATPSANRPTGMAGLAMEAVRQGKDALSRGEAGSALSWFGQALQMAPDDPVALGHYGLGLVAVGQLGPAIAPLFAAFEQRPDDPELGYALAQLKNSLEKAGSIPNPDWPSAKALLAALNSPRLNPQDFAPFCPPVLAKTAPINQALALLGRAGPDAAANWLLAPEGARALVEPLFLAYLGRTYNCQAEFERLLVVLRRRILADHRYQGKGAVPAAFLAALARQCQNNDYVWFESTAETEAIAALAQTLRHRIETGRKIGGDLLAFTLYRPLADLPNIADLSKRGPVAEPEARRLAQDTYRMAEEEAAIAPTLPSLTPGPEGVSAAVARQYEESPYPRWFGLTLTESGTRVGNVVGATRTPATAEGLEVLIAGCGTGQHALDAAIGYGPSARVLAIDLSRASLAYAERLRRRYQVANARFAQADILALDGFEPRFDIIECIGVLHHLADPLKGWRILGDRLKPGGTMLIGLYSQNARRAVNEARQTIAAQGFSASDADMRRFRAERLELRLPGDELTTQYTDFYYRSGVRDLLFHVQEHQFTLPAIDQALRSLGLDFAGFQLPPAQVAALMVEHRASPLDLGAWEAIESRHPTLFRGMYVFACRKPS